MSGYSDETSTLGSGPVERALRRPFTREVLLLALDTARARHVRGTCAARHRLGETQDRLRHAAESLRAR